MSLELTVPFSLSARHPDRSALAEQVSSALSRRVGGAAGRQLEEAMRGVGIAVQEAGSAASGVGTAVQDAGRAASGMRRGLSRSLRKILP